MTFVKSLQILERIDALIIRKSTGNPSQLANKIGVSERSVYNYLNLLKELGGEINYCTRRMSYFYSNEKRLFIGYLNDEKK